MYWENVVGQASRLPLGRLSPVFSRARRRFIAGRRPAPLFFKHVLRVHPGSDAPGHNDVIPQHQRIEFCE